MPVRSFLELGGSGARVHVGLTSDASEHTRFIRMAATLAPYVGTGVNPTPNALGWRSQEANRDARIVAPIYGRIRSFLPEQRVMDADTLAHQQVVQAQTDGLITDANYRSAKTMYQSSRLQKQTSDMIDDFLEKTPSPRPATTGTPDAEEVKQRKKILALQAKHLYVIQAGLLTVLFCILALLILPGWAAQMISILILATGIAAAIYLSQIQ
jgi:hypothetical protein